MRHVIVLSRTVAEGGTEVVVVGPYRDRERADRRAATIRRLAGRYEETPDVSLEVHVEPLAPGGASAQLAMDLLYGAEVLDGAV